MNDLELAWAAVRAEAELLSRMGAFPIWTDGDSWVQVEFDQGERGILPHHGSWMVGDLPAILWFLATGEADETVAARWREQALRWTGRLGNRQDLTSFASVGQIFFRGVLLPLAISGEESLRPLALAGAKTVSERFRKIGYMKSFGEPGDREYPFTTVDDVINLAVPLWYANQTGDGDLEAAALEAVRVIAEELVRPDGSTGQVLLIDEDGRPNGVETYQGYSADGCWSRGQAWGIYGFATVHRITGDAMSLELAQRMAGYWIDHVQDDPSPIWDFDLPAGEPVVRDSFAATLAYAGLLELAESSSADRREHLRDYAHGQLTSLASKYVLGRSRGGGIVGGAALDVPHKHGIDASVIVGDSYFTEALWRLGASGVSPTTSQMFPR